MGGCDGAGALTVLVGAVLEVEDRQLTEPIDERPDGLRQRGARSAVELGRLVRALRVREVHNPRAGGGVLAQRLVEAQLADDCPDTDIGRQGGT